MTLCTNINIFANDKLHQPLLEADIKTWLLPLNPPAMPGDLFLIFKLFQKNFHSNKKNIL